MVLAQSPPVPAPARRQAAVTSGLVATVVFLAAIAPLATDMYVPAFPSVAGDRSATATQVQLTLTTFFVGMALGQLIGGPVLVAVPESLPAERRHGGGMRTFARAGRQVLAQRRYVGYLLVSGSAMGALFAYVATSAFVLQSMNGMSPIAYSVDFAANAAGMTVAAPAAGVAMPAGALWFGTPLLLAVICFFVPMTAQGLIGPNGGALASAEVPAHPGPGRRSSASSSGSRPAPSRRSPGSAASTPPYAWHCS